MYHCSCSLHHEATRSTTRPLHTAAIEAAPPHRLARQSRRRLAHPSLAGTGVGTMQQPRHCIHLIFIPTTTANLCKYYRRYVEISRCIDSNNSQLLPSRIRSNLLQSNAWLNQTGLAPITCPHWQSVSTAQGHFETVSSIIALHGSSCRWQYLVGSWYLSSI